MRNATKPYLVNVQGPDDIFEFDTWVEACESAHEINTGLLGYNSRSQHPGAVRMWAIPHLAADYWTEPTA